MKIISGIVLVTMGLSAFGSSSKGAFRSSNLTALCRSNASIDAMSIVKRQARRETQGKETLVDDHLNSVSLIAGDDTHFQPSPNMNSEVYAQMKYAIAFDAKFKNKISKTVSSTASSFVVIMECKLVRFREGSRTGPRFGYRTNCKADSIFQIK